MGYWEELEEWRQPDRLVVPKQEHMGVESQDQTGDGVKHFCMGHILKVRRGESRPDDFDEFERVMASCAVPGYYGLLHRSPTKTGEQATKDVYVSASYCAKVMKSRLAYVILNRGTATRLGPLKWFYPNLFPTLFASIIPLKILLQRTFWECWRGLNPEVITHLQWCGLPHPARPHKLRVLWQSAYFCWVTTKHSGLCSLTWMMAEAARGQSRLGDHAIQFWEWRLKRRWPRGMPDVLTDELEPSHPIVRFWV
jgi:hypothetical protein